MRTDHRGMVLLLVVTVSACTYTPPRRLGFSDCWEQHGDVPVASADVVTAIGATPGDVIDVVDESTFTALLLPDDDLGAIPPREVTFTVRISAWVSAFERELFDETEGLQPCLAGPLLVVDVVATVASEDLGPGVGRLELWSRAAAPEATWVSGRLILDDPPPWIEELRASPGAFRLDFDALAPYGWAPYEPEQHAGYAWTSPSGQVGWHADSHSDSAWYDFTAAEPVAP